MQPSPDSSVVALYDATADSYARMMDADGALCATLIAASFGSTDAQPAIEPVLA